MAAQDFANIEVPHEEVEKPLTAVKTMLLTGLSVLLILATFMGGFWLGKKQGIETASGEDKARLEKLLKEQRDEMTLLRQQAAKRAVQPEVSTTQVGDLTFYNELPSQSVKPAPLHAGDEEVKALATHTSAPSPSTLKMRQMIAKEMQQTSKQDHAPAVSKQTSDVVVMGKHKLQKQGFVLQVASFQKKSDAEVFLPKLTKHGFSPKIRRVKLANLGVWYRVYIVGYASREAANQAKNALKKSLNITSLVLKDG